MSVKIRMRRMGRKQHPVYALVATDSRSARDGKFIEDLGRYEPVADPARFSVKADRVVYWLGQGAQMSDTARNLLQKEGVLMQSAMSRAGKTAEEIETALGEFTERRAAKTPTKVSNADRRANALRAEREQAAAKAKEIRAEQQAREAELERQRQESEDAARAEAQLKAQEAAAAETAADPGAAALAAVAEAGLTSDLAGQQAMADSENAAEANPEPMGDTSAGPSPNSGADQGAVQGTSDPAEIVAETSLLDTGAEARSEPETTAEAESTPGDAAAAAAGQIVADRQAAIETAATPGADAATEDATAAEVAEPAADAAETQEAVPATDTATVADEAQAAVVSQADAGAADGNEAAPTDDAAEPLAGTEPGSDADADTGDAGTDAPADTETAAEPAADAEDEANKA